MRGAILGVIAVVSSWASASAQSEIGPKAGTWGGEGCLNYCGVSLLHFRDRNSAWLLGANVYYSQGHIDESGTTLPPSSRSSTGAGADARLGMRFYNTTAERVRPFLGLAATLGYSGVDNSNSYRYGATSELGASYFFTPHLSLGLSGSLNLTEQIDHDRSGGFITNRRMFFGSIGTAQLLAAVYF